MTDQAVAALEQRLRERHAADRDEARRHLEAAEDELREACRALDAAKDAEAEADTVANARRTDAAFNRCMVASNARLSARRRVDALENEYAVEAAIRNERDRALSRAEARERERAEREAKREAAPKKKGSVTVATIERGGRSYPAVEDTGDGLATADREKLRALCKKNGLSVGGHKATIVERLRAAGVTA